MIYSTHENKTTVYGWNTALEMELETGTLLSDYTELEEEFDEETLKGTYDRVCLENKNVNMKNPALMTITTGINKSCRVWADKSLLKREPKIEDPKKDFEYYSEQ